MQLDRYVIEIEAEEEDMDNIFFRLEPAGPWMKYADVRPILDALEAWNVARWQCGMEPMTPQSLERWHTRRDAYLAAEIALIHTLNNLPTQHFPDKEERGHHADHRHDHAG